MKAFYIVHSTVKDPARFQEYAKAVGPTLAPFGGKVVLKGKCDAVLSGNHPHENVGVLAFPDTASAQGWYDSEAYQRLVPSRDAAAELVVIRFEAPQM